MLRRVTLVRTDVSEELSAYIISVTRIGEVGTALAATSNRGTLRIQSEFVFLRNVGSYKSHTALHPEDDILHGNDPLGFIKYCEMLE
jgi:hypothetical protein